MYRIGSTIVALALLVPLAAGASPQRGFDPYEQLEGYKEAFFDDYSRLYDFGPFEERSGKRLTAAEFEGMAKRWEAEKARVTARIEVIETDPVEGYLFDVDGRLGRRDFFEQTEMVRVDGYRPFYFYVERPFKRKEGFEEEFARQLGPWVAKLAEVFERTYVAPLELERKKRFGGVAIVALASRGRYTDYASANFSPGLHDSAAHYDPKLRVAVTHRDKNSAGGAAKEIRRDLLHELVHALQHAHCRGDLPRDTWLTEGMAEYLSMYDGRTPDCLEERPVDRDAVETLVPFTEPELSALFLPGLGELAGLEGYGGIVRRVGRALRRAGYVVRDEATLGVHYAHASLLVHFLHHGDEGKYNDAFLAYVDRAFDGAGGTKALEAAFEGHDLAEVDRSFLRWVRDQYRAQFPDRSLDELPMSITKGPATKAPARPPFDPSMLRPEVASADATLALAVGMARGGAMKGAADLLTRWLGDNEGDGAAPRIERERARMRGFEELRARFVQQLREEDKKFILDLPEGKLIADVEGLEGTVVRLAENRREIAELDLESVDPVALADLMRNERKYGMRRHWLMAYPYVLTGQHEGMKRLFDSSADSKALQADGDGDFAELRRVGEALDELLALAADATKIDATNAEALLGRAEKLLKSGKGIPAVGDRRDGLAALAAAALEAQFAGRGLDEMFRGKVEERGGGIVRFTYDFQKAAELEDFDAIDGDYPYNFGNRPALPDFSDPFQVKGGGLQALGLATIRHRATLEAPSARYEAAVREPYSSDGVLFAVGICDDGYGSFVLGLNFGGLLVVDKKGPMSSDPGKMERLNLGVEYVVEMKCDGKLCRSRVDGEDHARVPLGSRTSGSVFVSCGMRSTLFIDRLVIEGKLSDAAKAAMAASWVDKQLEERGF